MALRPSWFQGITLTLAASGIALSAAIGGGLIGIAQSVGGLEASFQGIEKRMDDRIAQADRMDAKLDAIASSITAGKINLERMIVEAGVASKGDVFTAAIANGHVWAFPDVETSARWEEIGLKRRAPAENANVSGFPLTPVSTIEGLGAN